MQRREQGCCGAPGERRLGGDRCRTGMIEQPQQRESLRAVFRYSDERRTVPLQCRMLIGKRAGMPLKNIPSLCCRDGALQLLLSCVILFKYVVGQKLLEHA